MGLFDQYTGGFNPNLINFPMQRQTTAVPLQTRDLEKVNGIESARQYVMPPNSRVALFDINDDVFYVRETDASGFPTIRKFRFVEESETALPADTNQYVTYEEFNKFKEEILNGQQSIFNAEAAANAKSAKSKRNDADISGGK